MAFKFKSKKADLFEYWNKLKGKKKIKAEIMTQGEVWVFAFLGPRLSAPYVCPRPSIPQIYRYSFKNRLVWLGWSIKILHKNVVIFKNTTYVINRKIFRVLFVQGTFSAKPFVNSGIGIVASINTTNTKVCMFRGLSRDLIKVWNWDILRACATENLHKCYK